MALATEIRSEWRHLKNDPPGQRFQNHHDRMRHGSKTLAVARGLLGLLLLATGVVLCFVPGPGLLVIVFGLALLAGMWTPLARAMDRLEPRVRRWGRVAKHWWDTRSTLTKGLLVAIVGAACALALFGMYRYWLGA